MQNVGETNAGDAMARIMDGMNKVVEEGGNLYDALDGFMEKYNKNIKQLPFSSDALKLMNILKNIRKEAGQTQTFLESTQRAAESKTEELMLQDLRKSNQGILSSSDIPELNTYLQQATTYVQRLRSDVEYLNAKREKGKKLTELETAELERLNERKEKGIMLNKLEESRLEELNDKRRKGENLTDSELKELKEKNRLLGVYQYNIDQVENVSRPLDWSLYGDREYRLKQPEWTSW